MWSDKKVRELLAVKLLHNSLLNITVVAFKVLPLGSYSPMPTPSPLFKTILELVLWKDLQSCHRIPPDINNIIKTPSFQYFLYLREQKKVIGGWIRCSSTVIYLLAKTPSHTALKFKLRYSRECTPKHTQTIIDATQKDTAIDQQQHSCETLICQCH
jgi:hypothetical protein